MAQQMGSETGRRPDSARTRRAILDAAREEFAERGLAGARVDAIAARTDTAKRMIYYYFGSKEGLYLAVLEAAYADVRRSEQALDLDSLPADVAMRRFIEFTFDYDEANPWLTRLISNENIFRARHVQRSADIQAANRGVLALLERVVARGRRDGVFTKEVAALDLHLMISAFCFYRVANSHTFGTLFEHDLTDPALRRRHRQLLIDAVMGVLGLSSVPRAGRVAKVA